MKTPTLAIAIACVAALAVPAVAFAALAPSPMPAALFEHGVSGGYHHADHRPAAANQPEGVQSDPSARAGSAQTDPSVQVPRAAERAEKPVDCPAYVDANGDGICDNCAAGSTSCPGYRDVNGDGVCDNAAASSGRGACSGFVDANGDGICDNCSGRGAVCPGYADADGDGACDNYESGRCGRGAGRGTGHHGAGHGCMR